MKKNLMIMSLLLCSVFMITGCKNNTEEENGEKANYAFGVPTTESSTNYKDVMKDNDTNVLLKLKDEKISVCIYVNKKLECFEANNAETEKEHLKSVLGTENYRDFGAYATSSNEEFSCNVYEEDIVICTDEKTGRQCAINGDNTHCKTR